MTLNTLLEKLAQLMEIDLTELTPMQPLSAFGTWDSLTKVSLLGIIASETRLSMTSDILERCETAQDIFNWIEAK